VTNANILVLFLIRAFSNALITSKDQRMSADGSLDAALPPLPTTAVIGRPDVIGGPDANGNYPPSADERAKYVLVESERRVVRTSKFSSWMFAVGVFLIIIAIIFTLILPRSYRWIVYILAFIGLIMMLVAAFVYCLAAPDRYCSGNPSDDRCNQRYFKAPVVVVNP
jgi:hypothetical protein